MFTKKKPPLPPSLPKKPVQAGPCPCGGRIMRTLLTSYRAETRLGTVPVDVMGWTCTKGGDACVERA
jgi:hypothetical protein